MSIVINGMFIEGEEDVELVHSHIEQQKCFSTPLQGISRTGNELTPQGE